MSNAVIVPCPNGVEGCWHEATAVHDLTLDRTASSEPIEYVPSGVGTVCGAVRVSEPEYLSETGIRIELFSEPFNQPGVQASIVGKTFEEIFGHAPRAETLACLPKYVEDSIMDEEDRRFIEALLKAYAKDGSSWLGTREETLARVQEMVSTVVMARDYESAATYALRLREMKPDELWRIPKDVRATALVSGPGGSIEARMHGTHVIPTEDLVELSINKFDAADPDTWQRALDTMRMNVLDLEHKRVFDLLRQAGTLINTVTQFSTQGQHSNGRISNIVAGFENVRYQIEQHQLIADKAFINRQFLSDLCINAPTAVDPCCDRALNLTGYVGRMLNTQLRTVPMNGCEEFIRPDELIMVAEAAYVGEMMSQLHEVRIDDDKLTFVWRFGACVVNPKAVAVGELV